ncbi:MAG: alanine--tRNA ligase, partial [Thermomicrobiaceae bacterium]|nr:alanine--tRNA ligase [Thermomicrobiaceae bacterium]
SASRFADAARQRADLYAGLTDKPVEFLGYDHVEAAAQVIGILGVEDALDVAEAGDQVEILLDRTPFYGEAGGQVGDVGTIATDTGIFDVQDTQRPSPALIVHRGVVREGFIRLGQSAVATIDAARRADIRRNHTATHLLHAALRQVLGEHAQQAGSLVAPDRLRFDFTSLEPLSAEQRRRIQELVNEQIIADKPVEAAYMSYREATATGAMALFGEKYGETVRVISIPGFSKELCGGTHVAHTGEIGTFVITEESSIGSGVRRVEALTGRAATAYVLSLQETAERLARSLHVPLASVPVQVEQMSERLREQEREIERLRVELATVQVGDLLARARSVD